MVEMDVQFLAGVAVTVFLALLFFGVVVLWDVALALRSVGDKIDKLEDNIDDDLTEIGHSLDNMSNVSGGGTQLHLSGGTISGGGPTNPEAPRSDARAARDRRGDDEYRHPQRPPGDEAADPDPYPEREPDRPGDGPGDESASEPAGDESDSDDRETRDETTQEGVDESIDSADEPASDDDADGTRPADGAATPSNAADGTADGDTDEAAEEESTPHPRAARNRGRFVTEPDVTPWYVTPLDRDAIANAGPEIAGELESADGSSRDEPDEDPIVAGPASEDDIAADADVGEADGAGVDPGDEIDGPNGSPEADDAERERDSSGDATANGSGAGATSMPPDPDATGASSGVDGGTAESGAEGNDGSVADGTAPDERSEPSESDAERSADSGADEPVFTDGRTGSSDPPEPVDPTDDGETDAVLSYDESETDDVSLGDDPVQDAPDDVDFGDVSALGRPDPDEDDVTVEEAVDGMNDDAPSLSLSSHDFDVVAEADEDGVVLRFEFDPAVVELTGSTKRLLRYQLRSFADDGSTPEGEVAIEGQTIVVEIPDPDGNDVQRWGEAAVSIIDRTLYLSDNSG